ncbi:hypothetical protein DNHGIG_35600 [Collibacillus ludicampi]|uniref:Uncharacterized protein n=1 Tax=Collibacillus ludicampi TaxID=2771369 RepID=A0AAV4LJF7_9BACL|nr:hypothetical protein [Collibacillus ludicampi]GIM48011.1 hypothetical protein DNHGIG_35600 [Collibacillus ludicampi]
MGIANKLQQYNLVIEYVAFHQYQFILYVQTHYGEQRVAVHYNSKKEITSVQLLDGIRNIDDQLILTILASFKNDGNSIVNYGNAFAAVSHPAMIGIPQQDQVSFKQAVVEAVLPMLNESVALYRMMSVT